MDSLHASIANGLEERYTYLATTVRELAAKLSEEQFWQKPFSFGNTFGHLVLHLTGNLNYYIGTEIAGTGYVRDRDQEFDEPKRLSKTEVLRNFDRAIEVVLRAIHAQSEEDWSKSYTAAREEDASNRFNIFLRCATHLHHHVGQMVYLCFELGRSSG
ncbi:MAG: DinB family protein [Acidobacteria bacterium]|nr:MAG: DinB family protein [Acidobacteriota bacterium]